MHGILTNYGHPEAVVSERRDSDRRTRGVALRWPDRRTGFDRRRSYPVSGTLRTDERWFASVLALIFVLGILDWALTYYALGALGATEANPFMRAAFESGPGAALALKVVSLGTVVAGMWWLRRYRSVIVLAAVAALLHLALIGYHIAGATLLS
jgi:hypothetical protein